MLNNVLSTYNKLNKAQFYSLYFNALYNKGTRVQISYQNQLLTACIYQQSKRIFQLLEEAAIPSSQVSVRKRTIAQEQVLQDLYLDIDLGVQNRGAVTKKMRELDCIIRQGKRQNMLQQAFRVGVFIVIPLSSVPNYFVERTLTIEQLLIQIKLIQKCNPYIRTLCNAFRLLYTAYINQCKLLEQLLLFKTTLAQENVSRERVIKYLKVNSSLTRYSTLTQDFKDTKELQPLYLVQLAFYFQHYARQSRTALALYCVGTSKKRGGKERVFQDL